MMQLCIECHCFETLHQNRHGGGGETVIAIDGWKYKHYFELISLSAGNKMFLTSKLSTSNLLKHLEGSTVTALTNWRQWKRVAAPLITTNNKIFIHLKGRKAKFTF